MELFVKIGNQTITVTQMGHMKIPGVDKIPLDTHRVVMADAVTGDMELVSLDSEREALVFMREFLDPDGYPTGGLYDTLVRNKNFKM